MHTSVLHAHAPHNNHIEELAAPSANALLREHARARARAHVPHMHIYTCCSFCVCECVCLRLCRWKPPPTIFKCGLRQPPAKRIYKMGGGGGWWTSMHTTPSPQPCVYIYIYCMQCFTGEIWVIISTVKRCYSIYTSHGC